MSTNGLLFFQVGFPFNPLELQSWLTVDWHSFPAGGGNAPILCLLTADETPQEEEETSKKKTKKKQQLGGYFSISVSPSQSKGNNCRLNNVWNRLKFKQFLMIQNL